MKSRIINKINSKMKLYLDENQLLILAHLTEIQKYIYQTQVNMIMNHFIKIKTFGYMKNVMIQMINFLMEK